MHIRLPEVHKVIPERVEQVERAVPPEHKVIPELPQQELRQQADLQEHKVMPSVPAVSEHRIGRRNSMCTMYRK